MNRRLRVFHLIKDDKFFDSVINDFEADSRFLNKSFFVTENPNYKFLFIKQVEKVNLICGREKLREIIKSPNYDILFFHSIRPFQYDYFRIIPPDKIVIWWCWGFELYFKNKGLPVLLPLKLYKPQTQRLIDNIRRDVYTVFKDFVKEHIAKYYYQYLRNQFIRRVDFFQPVIPLEYQMMRNIKGFRAEEFYYPNYYSSYQVDCTRKVQQTGGVLLGNSASYSNNHLDIWDSVKCFIPDGRDVIIPLSYGSKDYAEKLSTLITSSRHNINLLKDFLPSDEYFRLVDGCSYALFGVIRQQAMGNVFHCLFRSMKVFLYKDSLAYVYLKQRGYSVYTIEEIDENSFNVPLTEKEIKQNADALETEKQFFNFTRESAINKIIKQLHE